jgi:hypothetical protein
MQHLFSVAIFPPNNYSTSPKYLACQQAMARVQAYLMSAPSMRQIYEQFPMRGQLKAQLQQNTSRSEQQQKARSGQNGYNPRHFNYNEEREPSNLATLAS